MAAKFAHILLSLKWFVMYLPGASWVTYSAQRYTCVFSCCTTYDAILTSFVSTVVYDSLRLYAWDSEQNGNVTVVRHC